MEVKLTSLGGEARSLSVVPENVRQVGNYVYGLADTLRQALDTAAREVDACAGVSWTGNKADKFANGWSETHAGGITIINALTEMAEKLGVTAETYTQRDEANSALLSTFSLDLPDM